MIYGEFYQNNILPWQSRYRKSYCHQFFFVHTNIYKEVMAVKAVFGRNNCKGLIDSKLIPLNDLHYNKICLNQTRSKYQNNNTAYEHKDEQIWPTRNYETVLPFSICLILVTMKMHIPNFIKFSLKN